MKIAHVTATFPPYWAGTGNVAYHNARILHERGHDVTVFTAEPVGKDKLSFPFRVEYLPAKFRIGNAPLTPSLPRLLKGFDIIHLHYPYIFGAELTLMAAKRYGTPLLVTYHNDLLSPGWKGSLFRLYTRFAQPRVLRSVSQVAATSMDYGEASYLRRSIDRTAPILEIPNGVDTELFHPVQDRNALRASLGLPIDRPVVLFVGGLDTPHFFKGVPVLLEAMARVKEAVLAVAGDGDLRPQFEQAAKQLVPGRARFLGKVPLEDLVRLYQSSSVTVLPSTTMGEAFGMVLIESMACGTPVIASNLPGVRSVVGDGEDGLLVAPGDSIALATAISAVVGNVDLWHSMRSKGRVKVTKRYSWDHVAGLLEKSYLETLSTSYPMEGVETAWSNNHRASHSK